MLRAVVVAVCLVLAGVSTGSTDEDRATSEVQPLPVGTDVDYQLGGNRAVPDHVGIVVRDREAEPTPDAEGRYDVCYVNAFQTQPGAERFWRARWGLVLKRSGRPVVDGAWGEWLLDLRTARKRVALARVVGRWTNRCARDGFEAVEYDNLDSFTRSRGLMTRRQAVAFSRLIVARAHRAGLAAGQKNLSDLDGRRVGFDFAVAEECGRYDDCAAYTEHFGRRVLAIEYRRRDFARTCERYGEALAVVLRDRDVAPRGVREWC